MTEHKEVEPVVAYRYTHIDGSYELSFKQTSQQVKSQEALGIIEPNTTTIPTAEYEQLKAENEELKYRDGIWAAHVTNCETETEQLKADAELGKAIRPNYETAKEMDIEYIRWNISDIDEAIDNARSKNE